MLPFRAHLAILPALRIHILMYGIQSLISSIPLSLLPGSLGKFWSASIRHRETM